MSLPLPMNAWTAWPAVAAEASITSLPAAGKLRIEEIADPLTYQIAYEPSLFFQRMSLRPSPLKSAVEANCQLASSEPSDTIDCTPPFICQTATWLLSLRQRMSL